jgi:hypothetical protein
MWKLSGRDNKVRQWAELGEFQSISDAARRLLELENDPLGALFFRVYVDPPGEKSDAGILCRLECQSDKDFICSTAPYSDFSISTCAQQTASLAASACSRRASAGTPITPIIIKSCRYAPREPDQLRAVQHC